MRPYSGVGYSIDVTVQNGSEAFPLVLHMEREGFACLFSPAERRKGGKR